MSKEFDVMFAANLIGSGGGGTAPTLIEKDITANGTYIATNDNADGYSKVVANVPNTYTVEDEGKVVDNGALVAQTSATYTANDTYDTTLVNSVTVNVPSSGGSGVEEKDVNFYDYDGTCVYSYTAQEFLALSAMPDNPTHEGLTAQGWNWSFSDATTYVTNYSKLNVGQMYITNDGKTRIYITLTDDFKSPVLTLNLSSNTELDIDWGDNSTHSSFVTTNSAQWKSERHNYSNNGNYVIAISVISGSFSIGSNSNPYYMLLSDGHYSTFTTDCIYMDSVQNIEIGTGITNLTSLIGFHYLTTITIPNNITTLGSSTFFENFSLCNLIIPNSCTTLPSNIANSAVSLRTVSLPSTMTISGDSQFRDCSSLISMAIPKNWSYVPNSYLYHCRSLIWATLPSSVTSINNSAFSQCSLLSSMNLPNTITSLYNGAFSYCESIKYAKFPDNITTIPVDCFRQCGRLCSVQIPNGVTSIGNAAFMYAYPLQNVTIPSTVTSIGQWVFTQCSNLKYIKFEPTTPPTVANINSWQSIPTTCIVYVPALVSDLYITGTNYPNPSTYNYIGYATYENGVTLPTLTTDETYTLTWYATVEDAIAGTNAITEGNGNEVYSIATAVV